jgi:hypothetical protein
LKLNLFSQPSTIGKVFFFPMATMLTKSTLFFLNLCNDYRDLQEAKAKCHLSEAWLEHKLTTASQPWRPNMDDSDSDARAPKATSSKSSRKHLINSDVAVGSHAQALPAKKSRKAPISTSGAGDSETVCYEEPMNAQTSAGYGGLEDEDDNKEWETIKRSPAKGPGVCISDHVNRRYVRLSTPR